MPNVAFCSTNAFEPWANWSALSADLYPTMVKTPKIEHHRTISSRLTGEVRK